MKREPVIEIEHLVTRFGDIVVHEDISLTIERGEIFAIAGASGCGKSTLLREIVMLMPLYAGRIRVLGRDIAHIGAAEAARLRRRWAMMFQGGALFSGLTVAENVALPLREHTDLTPDDIVELAHIKIALAGLPAGAANKFPRELSGGLKKRAALARAIALDPELLFLDEPSSGLDPLAASGLDELVLSLKESLKLTIIIVTHDLDLLWRVTDRVAILGDKRVVGLGTMPALAESPHPLVREYFHGPRGRAVGALHGNQG
ncbi:MAG: ATP-binding cassette domain-containing protein [Hydrogenophilales bacterium]|nr:ATP-binding cassette domain-containing protein [Hydrogenophilales bacterium]